MDKISQLFQAVMIGDKLTVVVGRLLASNQQQQQ
jgi:hypothetical protein